MVLEYLLRKFRFVRRLENNLGEQAEQNRRLGEDVRRLVTEKDRAVAESAEWRKFFPPGHFYSPLPSREEIAEAFARGGFGPPFPAIDLQEKEQMALFDEFAEYYREQPFTDTESKGRRYSFDNPSYGPHDSIFLYCMLRHLQPKRIIEVGSGHSSAAMLDLNELVFDRRISITFIDPDMTRLRPLLRGGDRAAVTLVQRRVQDVPLDLFAALEANDVLFIDSSHVSKVGSDVNHLFFNVLPILKPGVHVHLHDITGCLEYPRHWCEEGRAWNEQYLLRAFLMYNPAFKIAFFSAWVFEQWRDSLRKRMPLCSLEGGGGQIWLRRTAASQGT